MKIQVQVGAFSLGQYSYFLRIMFFTWFSVLVFSSLITCMRKRKGKRNYPKSFLPFYMFSLRNFLFRDLGAIYITDETLLYDIQTNELYQLATVAFCLISAWVTITLLFNMNSLFVLCFDFLSFNLVLCYLTYQYNNCLVQSITNIHKIPALFLLI